MEKVKVKITSEKWGLNKVGEITMIPKFIVREFLMHNYGVLVKIEDDYVTSEQGKRGRGRQKKH